MNKIPNHTTKLALALGGGGVRGAAHLGVLRALHEGGLKIDAIAGTSSGAIAAIIFALGHVKTAHSKADLYKLVENVASSGFADLQHLFKDHKNEPLRDRIRTLTVGGGVLRAGLTGPGLVNAQPLRESLEDLVGNKHFEDLELPLAFMATDLMSGEKIVLQKGKLLESALASCAIPGILPPVELDGRFLIDGHVIDNIPVEAARDLVQGSSVVVAIDIGYEAPQGVPKTAFDVMIRAASISREHLKQASLNKADLVINACEEIPSHMFEYHLARDLFDAGFERGQALIPKILAAFETKESEFHSQFEKKGHLNWRGAISRMRSTLEA